ncbi:hypothetical protein B0H11DRAFT_2352514 [Mycena galericulata]|nr:hypothetical protein B0H11DRAFT_2352514 [Mycena galericulata]
MHNAAPISVLSNAPHASLNGDLLALAQARHQSGLPPWTEEEETFERRRLKLQRNYPRPVDPTSEELLEDYEIACVKTGVSRPSAEDYQSVLLVQSEEQALRNWEQQLQHPVQQMILHHPFVNTLPRVGINPDESLFDEHIRQTEEYQAEIVRQLTQRTFALVALEATLARPRSAYASAGLNLELAIRRNRETTARIEHHVRNLEVRIQQLISARADHNNMLSEGAINRGEFQVRMSDEATGSTYDIQSDSSDEPRSDPPSYPGSPHSSDELWLADGVPLSEIRNLTPPPAREALLLNNPPSVETESNSSSDSTGYTTAPEGADSGPSLRAMETVASSIPFSDNCPCPQADDVCIARTIMSPWPGILELYSTYMDCNGISYIRASAIPTFKYPNAAFEQKHRELLADAVRARGEELGRPISNVTHVMTWEEHPAEPETDLQNELEALSIDNDEPLTDLRIMAQAVEHSAGVRPPPATLSQRW